LAGGAPAAGDSGRSHAATAGASATGRCEGEKNHHHSALNASSLRIKSLPILRISAPDHALSCAAWGVSGRGLSLPGLPRPDEVAAISVIRYLSLLTQAFFVLHHVERLRYRTRCRWLQSGEQPTGHCFVDRIPGKLA